LQFGESKCDRVGNSLNYKHEIEVGKARIEEVHHADLSGSEKKLVIEKQNRAFEFQRKQTEILKGFQRSIDSEISKQVPRVDTFDSIDPADKDKRIMN
jgi:hypothetical protein